MKTVTRFIVVENEIKLRRSIVEGLSQTGLAVSSTGSAAECYQLLDSHDWRVAVIDIDLPDHYGYLLVEYIRANTNMKVIILTPRDATDDRVKGYDSGADIYLVKHIDCLELSTSAISLMKRQVKKKEQSSSRSHTQNSDQRIKNTTRNVTSMPCAPKIKGKVSFYPSPTKRAQRL